MIRIHFERSGGFAGMRMMGTIDSDSLPPQEEHELFVLVEAAGFFQLPEKITSPEPGGDRFTYRLTVETEGERHTVEVGDEGVPAALRPLLKWSSSAIRKVQRGVTHPEPQNPRNPI